MSKVVITLTNGQTDYNLSFFLLDYIIAQKWTKHLNFFLQSGSPWDDTERFYNFQSNRFTEPVVFDKINELLTTIKNYSPTISTRLIHSPLSQDDLNYLHHIFEVYHGLYDQQSTNEFYSKAPPEIQQALGDLNIWIHRYETLNSFPRFVATWKYKPYRDKFTKDDMELFNLYEEWGDLRLNYCEIGKNLYDLCHDNDQYINPETFQPHHHYCFDFTVRFNNKTYQEWELEKNKIWQYFDNHSEFFNKLGYKKYDKKLCLGGITIAKLEQNGSKEEILWNISQHQCFKAIRLENN
jgi:hypothetical protein